ncbi:hypothetical protein EPO04_03415 [Patescibacteria group bacterium]|nr:MAG: hypothetical protein EPO04_03415 [Patescibacteria group bacterium]
MSDIKLAPRNNSKGLTVRRAWNGRVKLTGHFGVEAPDKTIILTAKQIEDVCGGSKVTAAKAVLPRSLRKRVGDKSICKTGRVVPGEDTTSIFFPSWPGATNDLVLVSTGELAQALV